MPTKKERDSSIEVILKNLDKTLAFDVDVDLVKEIELGRSFSFADVKDTMENIQERCRFLKSVDYSQVSYQHMKALEGTLDRVRDTFEEISKFNPSDMRSKEERNRLAINVTNVFDSLLENSLPILVVDAVLNGGLRADADKLKTELDILSMEKDSAFSTLKKLQDETSQVLTSAQRAAGEVAVARYSLVFEQEAVSFEKQASKWLYWIIGLLVATAALICLFISLSLFNETVKALTTSQQVQFTVSKVVLLSLFFIALSICTRNYKAFKHNAIVNRHRQNSLSTFEAFIKAATDEQTKNAVLLQTTQSIFSNQSTGYTANDGDDSPSKIVEIVKSVTSKPN